MLKIGIIWSCYMTLISLLECYLLNWQICVAWSIEGFCNAHIILSLEIDNSLVLMYSSYGPLPVPYTGRNIPLPGPDHRFIEWEAVLNSACLLLQWLSVSRTIWPAHYDFYLLTKRDMSITSCITLQKYVHTQFSSLKRNLSNMG